MTAPRQPVLFISHGGGPWPYVPQLRAIYAQTERHLRALPARLPQRPKAVVTISGHWEAAKFSVATNAQPTMEYDYSGFPPHTYQMRYPAPGDPRLAARIRDLLSSGRIDSVADPGRGFDHGVFVPLGLMYPDADMPIVMVSIKAGYDPAQHLALGGRLAPLREEGILIIGSGLNYHNMRGFGLDSSTSVAELFTRYLNEAIELPDVQARNQRLQQWERAPGARLAHPREDHLMPLLVVAGAAQSDVGEILFTEEVMKIPMTSYGFGSINPDGASELAR